MLHSTSSIWALALCRAGALLTLAWVAYGSSTQAQSGLDTPPLHDTGPQGELWVRGADYKARFDREGLTFVPFLGSHAPRNFPVRFAAPQARLAGALLDLDLEGGPLRAGSAIRYERGAMAEEFHIESGSVEQVFRFGRLVSAGDLVVRIAFESELVARQADSEIRFEGPWGGVRYGEALALDGSRELLRTSPRLVDGAIEIRIPSATLAQARGPLTIDPLISTFVIVLSAPDDRDADVAYDASLDRYAVVWQRIFSQTDSDAHGKLLDASGNVVQQFLIDVTQENANDPRIAGIDALDQFCTMHRTGTSQGTLYARLLDATGGVVSVGAPIVAYTGQAIAHALGGDATNSPPYAYLYAAPWTSWAYFLDYRMLSPTGQIVGSGWLEDNYDSGFLSPRISKSAWISSGGQKLWILGCDYWSNFLSRIPMVVSVSVDGSAGQWLVWSLGVGNRLSDVSTPLETLDDQPTFLVVGSRDVSDPGEVQVRLVRGLSPQGTTLTLAPSQGANARVDTDGSSFVVSYTSLEQPGASERVQAVSLELSGGSLAISEQASLSPVGRVARRPALVSARKLGGVHRRFLVAWHQLSSGSGDIVGALYDTPGVGVRFCTAAPNSVGPGARIEASGSISLSANAFQLSVSGCPPSTPGLFYLGQNPIQFPFGEGFRCIGGNSARMFPALATDPQGAASLALNFNQPYGSLVLSGPPGPCYQFWYRDPAGGPAGFNLSDALRVQHLP